MPEPDELDTIRAVTVQESVRAFLEASYGREPVPVIVTALSYEIARAVGAVTMTAPDAQVERMIADVAAVMRQQIAAYRAGALRE